jgi:hypothetical protein
MRGGGSYGAMRMKDYYPRSDLTPPRGHPGGGRIQAGNTPYAGCERHATDMESGCTPQE